MEITGPSINKSIDANKETTDIIIVAEPIDEIMPEFPKPLSQTIWLCVSSSSFLIPSAYALNHSACYKWLYMYFAASALATIFSINHWRKAEDGIRRIMDKIVAWITFFIYFVTAFMYMPMYLTFSLLATVVSAFFVSDTLSKKHYPYWFFAHIFFHLSISGSKCVIIWYIIDTHDNGNVTSLACIE